MLHPARAAAVLLAAALACKESAPPAPPQVPPPRPDASTAFTLRDLALATALDARLARLSLVAADLEAALAGGAGARERSRTLAAELEVAKGEVGQAASAVAHPLDRPLAARAAALAAVYADRLLAAARGGGSPPSADAAAAREQLGGAIAGYRQARSGRRLDGPAPQGAEREFAEARREMERAETASVGRTRVAPREEGHELDPAAVRMSGRMAVERARAAAERLPPGTKEAAVRYASAQEKVLAAVAALSGTPDAEKLQAARAYHAAKADALAALADYFAVLAGR